MKKLLTLLTMLIVGIGSTWAEEKTFIIINNASGGVWSGGSYSNDNGSSVWKSSWTSNLIDVTTTTQICITASDYVLNNSNGQIGSSSSKSATFTISAMGEFKITGYDIKFKNVNTNGSNNQTITPSAGGDPATAEGTSEATVNVTGLSEKSATFTLTGENKYAKITYFKVYYEANSYSSGGTWSSGVSDDDIASHYSTIWYVKLKSPFFWDVFFDEFEMTHRSDGNNDYNGNTYLAFTYNTFTEQNNHKANEFIAISTNYSDRKANGVKNKVIYSFPEKVRLNGGETVYACFVSKNVDGTYNLQKRGLGVLSTSNNGTLFIANGNSYTTSESIVKNFQCHYTCNYKISYEFPDTRISSGINNKDKTYGGWIEIAYMKCTSPGSSGGYIHFDQFSMSMRNGNVVANTYLLFSKDCLTGTGVSDATEFEPGRFTAISTNCVPSANYGKVFTFTFDPESYLACGQTYYIYMGIKQNGKYRLRKYGIFIDHKTSKSGFEYSSALATAASTKNDEWQAIYYSNTYTVYNNTNLNNILSTFYNPVNRVKEYLGTELGEYSHPDYTTEQINTALISAETAKAGSDASAKEVSIASLRSISESLALNLPATNGFYRIKGHATEKYAKAGDVTVSNVNDNDDPTSLIPNSTGKETNGSDIWYYDSDKHLINYYNGLGTVATRAFAALSKDKETTTFAESSCTASGAQNIGVYELKSNYNNTSTIWYSNENNVDRNQYNNHINCEWDVEVVTSLPVTFNSSALGYATFNSPVALKVPKDVKAYVCRIDGSTITLYNANKFMDGDNWVLPANTPVLLYNEEYLTTDRKDFIITSTTGSYDGLNDFSYTVAAENPDATHYTYYALRKKSGSMGFYQRADQEAALTGFRAWIEVEKPAANESARDFTIVFDGDSNPTGIVEALGLENDNVEIYDLNGRKLSSYQKGINIVNGKKVFK